MEIKKSKTGSYWLINLTGRLDTSNYGELEKSLTELIESGENELAVDCSGLVYISSSGLRVFLMALKKITQSAGKFHLCCLQDNIHEIFEIAGFTSIFKIFNTLDEAVK